ncbi:hypothetical protein [Achromobacter aegrifaciens]
MTDHLQTRNASESKEILLVDDERRLPELIHGQIGKLNELDAGVKKALEAAAKAEERAKMAREMSAGRGFFTDKKRDAIEGLQEAGVELAGAVQLGTQAQKLSFEFQTRLAEITKYLFTLGVGNIAANRTVVRELEMRLRGASEEELSELARQEVMSVIRQLKEQEDLLRKQEKMKEAIRAHDVKISHLLAQADDLTLSIKNQEDRRRILVSTVDAMEKASKQQKEDISALQEQAFAQQAEIEALTYSLAQARSHAEDAATNLLQQIDDLERRFKDQDIQRQAIASKTEALEQVSQWQQQEIIGMQQQILMYQADLRWTVNVRTTLFVVWAIAVSVAVYFLH